VSGRDADWGLRNLVLALRESIYRADGLKSKKDDHPAMVHRIMLAKYI
jgi:leucyl aminopeptidase